MSEATADACAMAASRSLESWDSWSVVSSSSFLQASETNALVELSQLIGHLSRGPGKVAIDPLQHRAYIVDSHCLDWGKRRRELRLCSVSHLPDLNSDLIWQRGDRSHQTNQEFCEACSLTSGFVREALPSRSL